MGSSPNNSNNAHTRKKAKKQDLQIRVEPHLCQMYYLILALSHLSRSAIAQKSILLYFLSFILNGPFFWVTYQRIAQSNLTISQLKDKIIL